MLPLCYAAPLIGLRYPSDIRRWQSYVEPGDDLESGSGGGSNSPTKRISRNFDHDDAEDLSQLPENTLSRNLGLDLIVVVSKVS